MPIRATSTLRFFAYSHLPTHLQEISKPFHDLALHLEGILPEGAEKTVSIRKLLEAKDAAVRTMVKPLFITLKKVPGSRFEVNHKLPHSGSYVLMDGTIVLEDEAEEDK